MKVSCEHSVLEKELRQIHLLSSCDQVTVLLYKEKAQGENPPKLQAF